MEDEADRPVSPSDREALLAALKAARAARAPAPPPPEQVSYLGFLVGGELYGLPLAALREVARLPRLRPVPGAPPTVAGLVNLRGELLCALDARALLGLAPAPPAEEPFLVVLRGVDDPLALVVDAVADIYPLDPEAVEPPPATWAPERAALFTGTVRVADGVMGLLDLTRLVAG